MTASHETEPADSGLRTPGADPFRRASWRPTPSSPRRSASTTTTSALARARAPRSRSASPDRAGIWPTCRPWTPAALSAEAAFEREIALLGARRTVFDDEVQRQWEQRASAIDDVGDGIFILFARDFAPLEQRLEAITARLEDSPRLLREAPQQLGPATGSHVERVGAGVGGRDRGPASMRSRRRAAPRGGPATPARRASSGPRGTPGRRSTTTAPGWPGASTAPTGPSRWGASGTTSWSGCAPSTA